MRILHGIYVFFLYRTCEKRINIITMSLVAFTNITYYVDVDVAVRDGATKCYCYIVSHIEYCTLFMSLVACLRLLLIIYIDVEVAVRDHLFPSVNSNLVYP